MLKLNPVSMNTLQHREDLGIAALEKTATAEFFSIILLFFLYAKVIFSVHERVTAPRGLRDGCVGENGPQVSFFFYNSIVFTVC